MIRPAVKNDFTRIAEILVFNSRLYFYPIFKDEVYSFSFYNVDEVRRQLLNNELSAAHFYVYEDEVIKGCIRIIDREIVKLYAEHAFSL